MPSLLITVVVDTFLKKRNASSGDLLDSEKAAIAKGSKFAAVECTPDRNQHFRLILSAPILAKDGKTELKDVYMYMPHIQVAGDDNQLIKLPVVYRSQLDNDTAIFGPGWRQCNTTSTTMLADFLLKGELSDKAKSGGYNPAEPESVYMRFVGKYGDTTDHNAQTQALKDLGIDSYFSYTLSAKDILQSLKLGIPVVVGFAYKGSGHICLVVGHDAARKVWLVHDPYGSRHGASDSYDIGVGGAYDHYSYDVMQQIYWDQGGEAGWGRIVTSVKGQPTGLPMGL